MRVLHLLTRPRDPWAAEVEQCLEEAGEATSETVDLTASEPDYDALLERIFAADTVVVW